MCPPSRAFRLLPPRGGGIRWGGISRNHALSPPPWPSPIKGEGMNCMERSEAGIAAGLRRAVSASCKRVSSPTGRHLCTHLCEEPKKCDVIPAEAGIQTKMTGFPRIKCGAGSVKPGMTNKAKGILGHYTSSVSSPAGRGTLRLRGRRPPGREASGSRRLRPSASPSRAACAG